MTANLTPAQIAALRVADECGAIGAGWSGVRFSTAQKLSELGLVDLAVGKRTERMSDQGWTGRVYITQSWTAWLTDAGRAALQEAS